MKRWLGLLAILGAIVAVVALLVICPTRHQRRFDQIQVGMTVEEVDAVLYHPEGRIACRMIAGGQPYRQTFYDGVKRIDIELALDNDQRVIDKRITVGPRLSLD